jgi:NADH-quinone oxidoreductase subunit N
MPAYYLEIAIVVLGLVLLMADAFATTLDRRRLGQVALLGVATVFGALLFSVDHRAAAEPLWGFYATDGAAMFYKGLALVSTFFVLVLALEYAPVLESYRDGRPGQRGLGEFLCLPLFLCAGLMWMASMTDLLGLFVALEMVTITFYVAVAYMRRNVGSLEAGVKYLILGALSTGFLVYGLAWLFGLTGQTRLAAIHGVLSTWQGDTTPLLFAVALLMVGFAFKIGAVPMQFWIPDVYQGAPTPVTAFLSVGSKSAGFIVLIRLLEPLLASPVRNSVLLMLSVMAGATLLVGNLAALTQGNFKRLLAYSSIAHAGFLLVALAAGQPAGGVTPEGTVALYLGTYLVMTLLAFAVLIIVRKAGGSDDLSAFDGLAKRSPFLALALVLAMASLAGVPLTAGFFGKFFAILLAAGARQWALLAIAIVGAACGFYYYFKVIRSMYWNEPAKDAPPLEISLLTRATIVFLGAAIVILGVYPKPLTGLLAP